MRIRRSPHTSLRLICPGSTRSSCGLPKSSATWSRGVFALVPDLKRKSCAPSAATRCPEDREVAVVRPDSPHSIPPHQRLQSTRQSLVRLPSQPCHKRGACGSPRGSGERETPSLSLQAPSPPAIAARGPSQYREKRALCKSPDTIR